MAQREPPNSITRRACLRRGGLVLSGVFSALSGCQAVFDVMNETPTPTPTHTPTPTPSPTPTLSPTTKATPTDTPTVTETESLTPADQTETTDLENAKLVTYTNEVYGYQIKYPTNWTVSDSNPQTVDIFPPTGFSRLSLSVVELERQYTLDRVINISLQALREETSDVTVDGQREITLPNGQPGRVIELEYESPSSYRKRVRTEYLVAVNGTTVYQVKFRFLKSNYTPAIDRVVTRIIESFTITAQPTTPSTPTEPVSDISQFRTYTSEVYQCRLKYPATWTVYDSNPRDVEIAAPNNSAQIHLSIAQTGRQYTLDTFINRAIRSTRERLNDVTILSQQDVTLSNGRPAYIIDWTYNNPSESSGLIRSKYLATIRGGTVYQVEFATLLSLYTSAIDQVATRVIKSFTVIG